MKISIVTATYNSAATLRETLNSVLAQSYKNIEYWIIDGGSKDGTIDIIKTYEPLFYGRLHWLSEPDKGIYDAMNKGIERATGDIVGTLNSDDYFTSEDVLERIAEEFKAYPKIDAVYGDIHFVDERNPGKIVRYYSSKKFRTWRLRFGFMPAHPSFYARREVFKKYGLYALDYKIAADYDMMVRLFWKHHITAHYINKDFVTMRTGGTSNASMKHRLITTKEDVKACKRNGLYSNLLFVSCKYFSKIFEYKIFHTTL